MTKDRCVESLNAYYTRYLDGVSPLIESILACVELLIVDGKGLVSAVKTGRVSRRPNNFNTNDCVAMVIEYLWP